MLRAILSEAVENGDCVGGGDLIADLLAMALALDDAGPAHLIEMLRNRALLTADSLDNVTDPAFAMQIKVL